MSSSADLFESEDQVESFEDEMKDKNPSSNTGSIVAAVVITAVVVAVICVPTTYYLHPDYIDPDDPPLPIYDCPSEKPKISTERPVTTPQSTDSPNSENNRFDCGPDRDGIDQATCESRGCTWSPATTTGPPSCFYPEDYGTYDINEFFTEPWGYRVALQRRGSTPNHFTEGIDILWLDVELQTKSRLHFKIYDPNDERFEVPNNLDRQPTTKAEDTLYHVSFNPDPFYLQVTRTDTGTVVFDTSVGALVFEDQFLQLSTKLPSHNVYGFGEHEHESFRHDLNWKRWGSFARDQPPSTVEWDYVRVAKFNTDARLNRLIHTANANLYGTHPFYLCLENDFNAHGVFLNNANGQDVSLQPTPALTYRHIGGVFDFYMFFGPTPEDVVAQYTELIGRPYMPPYWALGFHLSRYGYNGIENVTRVVDRMRKYNIPHDVLYGDIDYMDRQRDFTIDEEIYGEANLANLVERIKEEGTNYIIILDPAIAANETAGTYRAYDKGVEDDVFIHDANGDLLFGKVWPDYPEIDVDPTKDWDYQTENYRSYAVFPDFQRQQTKDWWEFEITDFHKRINFDGIWIGESDVNMSSPIQLGNWGNLSFNDQWDAAIYCNIRNIGPSGPEKHTLADMNEPANFVIGSVTGCSNNKWDYPPYHPKIWGATMADKTVCMNAVQNWDDTTITTHYNMHNLYGWSQSEPTLRAARAATPGRRSMVITRSTYPGSGKYNGHWLGDNASIWPHVHKSIIGMLEFNLFGIPFIGADICGFFDDTTEKLCRRWSQLGNFYTFARNHNGLNYRDQDPAAFGEAFAVEMRDLFAIRYTLLPYLYTLHYKATAHGHTVIRSLMHEFTSDSNTWDIDRQFLWGPGFMITPVLDEDHTSVEAYIPKSRWYDWYTGKEVDQSLAGRFVTLDAPESYIPLHIRGGHILPTQQPSNSTKFSRNNPFGLIVALSEGYSAIGTLFWDDGESIDTISERQYYEIEYIVAENNLIASVMNSYGTLLENHHLDTISVHGMASRPPWVKLNGEQLTDPQWTFNDDDMILSIVDLQQPMTDSFKLSWK